MLWLLKRKSALLGRNDFAPFTIEADSVRLVIGAQDAELQAFWGNMILEDQDIYLEIDSVVGSLLDSELKNFE